MIVTRDGRFLPSASALYSYVLGLHKKVSLVCFEKYIDKKFSFLPWFKTIKSSSPSSADLVLELDEGIFELYDFFKKNNAKLNKKMSTALYASLLVQYNGFLSAKISAETFDIASELIKCGADYKTSHEFIIKRTTLARMRLKSIMFKNMILQNDAKEMVFKLCEDDLSCSGATLEDAKIIIEEALGLEYIQNVILLQDNKILKSIYKGN